VREGAADAQRTESFADDDNAVEIFNPAHCGHITICLSVCLSVCPLSIYLSMYPSISLFLSPCSFLSLLLLSVKTCGAGALARATR
jgi:hypothetical protein